MYQYVYGIYCLPGSPFLSFFLLLSLSFPLSPLSGLSAGIYATNGPDAFHYILEDCKANVIVIENQKQLDKILQVDKNQFILQVHF